MPLPKNISKDHLLKAFDKVDKEGVPSDAASRYYDVIHNGKRYPPKLIVSYGNLFANGKILDRKSFAGVSETQCFKLLEKKGFIVERKDYYPELANFLEQSRSTKLGTSAYAKSYAGLTVKVSFGQGNFAHIPWIAFSGKRQSVSKGIYPVVSLRQTTSFW